MDSNEGTLNVTRRTGSSGRRPRIPRAVTRHASAYGFLAVPLLLFVFTEGIPSVAVVLLSFTNYNPLVPGSWSHFVGLANYGQLLSDQYFWWSLSNVIQFAVFYIPSIGISLILAVLLNQPIRGRSLFRTMIFLPFTVSWIVAAILIMWVLDPQLGVIAIVMRRLGMGDLPYFLGSADTAMLGVAIVAAWKMLGYNMVIYLAGLQSIDPNLYDAAHVDGANSHQCFRHVTIPGLRNITLFVLVINMIQALRIFDPIVVLTQGGPGFATKSIVYYIYDNGWSYLKFGYANTIAVALFLLICVFSLINWRLAGNRDAQ